MKHPTCRINNKKKSNNRGKNKSTNKENSSSIPSTQSSDPPTTAPSKCAPYEVEHVPSSGFSPRKYSFVSKHAHTRWTIGIQVIQAILDNTKKEHPTLEGRPAEEAYGKWLFRVQKFILEWGPTMVPEDIQRDVNRVEAAFGYYQTTTWASAKSTRILSDSAKEAFQEHTKILRGGRVIKFLDPEEQKEETELTMKEKTAVKEAVRDLGKRFGFIRHDQDILDRHNFHLQKIYQNFQRGKLEALRLTTRTCKILRLIALQWYSLGVVTCDPMDSCDLLNGTTDIAKFEDQVRHFPSSCLMPDLKKEVGAFLHRLECPTMAIWVFEFVHQITTEEELRNKIEYIATIQPGREGHIDKGTCILIKDALYYCDLSGGFLTFAEIYLAQVRWVDILREDGLLELDEGSTEASKADSVEACDNSSTKDMGKCAKCGVEKPKISLHKCAHCKLVEYCKKSCQLKHWKVHKKECRGCHCSNCDVALGKGENIIVCGGCKVHYYCSEHCQKEHRKTHASHCWRAQPKEVRKAKEKAARRAKRMEAQKEA